MTLSNEERETIIRFDDSENIASIYTCNPSWKARLDKLMSERDEISLADEDIYSRTYILPKKWIKVAAPRILTEEERLKLANRARTIFKIGKINTEDKTQE